LVLRPSSLLFYAFFVKMDPLSVTASIVGLLGAAGKVIEILGPILGAIKDIKKVASTVYSELVNLKIILSALQKWLDDLNYAPRARMALIQIDQLVAVLTDGVILLSELEAIVQPLGEFRDVIRCRIQWSRREAGLQANLSRLQIFKSSISLMLNIIQW
jgi:hypothetical protein